MGLVKGLSILFIFSKNQLLDSLIFCIDFLDSISFISGLIFIISFLLLTLGFVFSSSLNLKLDCLFDFFLDFWDRYVTLWISLLRLLSQCPTDFGLLCLHFQGMFWFLHWSHCWPTHCLVTFYLASILFEFFSVPLWLISSFMALWSEEKLDMISIFLNLLRLVLCPNMWSTLENIPCTLEKYVYFAAFGWNALKIRMKSISSSVLFKGAVSLLIFSLEDLPFEVNGVLRSRLWLYFSWSLPLCPSRFPSHFRWSYVGCINVN